jgi:predicted 2-oxoglutarate/Fe(II)-dependent dioxygenase YbiX
MRERDGNTVGVFDHNFKRRKDFRFDSEPEYEELRAAVRARINRRVVPEVRRAFQFNPTRIERYLVSCYEGELSGFFRAHRDNTTKGTAHRMFACTINLNEGEYQGGDLCFPEFGTKTYRAPTGGVVVFSCSLLHEALPVTKGRRYAFLPFLYDEAAAKVRATNQKFLTGEVIDKTQ